MWNRIYLRYKYRIFPKAKHLRGTTRLLQLLERKALNQLEQINQSETEPIFKEDWDNLIIADACRKDVLEEVLNREVESRYSLGSRSPEYIENTFSNGDYSDIVYITANPYFHPPKFKELTGRNIDEVFHSVFHTYKTDWNEEKGTVLPEAVIRDAKTAENLFPDKKKIIHFMQPHYPFINYDIGREQPGFNRRLSENENKESKLKAHSAAEIGEIERETMLNAHIANMDFLWEEIQDSLLENLKGKTILTADHGQLIGEKGIYGHPKANNVRKLREVPWVKL